MQSIQPIEEGTSISAENIANIGQSRSYRSPEFRDGGQLSAMEHIRERERLTRQLGGSVRDVTDYFFALPPTELHQLLNEYETQFGIEARDYAEMTYPKWKARKVQMSGLVAGRLFLLLPPRMPLAEKYRLTQSLWQNIGPKSHKVLVVGNGARAEEVILKIRAHVEGVIGDFSIPDQLQNRFNWLSAGDVQIKQTLLNYVQKRERAMAADAAAQEVPVLLRFLERESHRSAHRLSQQLEIGNHRLEVEYDSGASGVRLEEPSDYFRRRSLASAVDRKDTWKFWAFAICFVLFLGWLNA